MQTLTIAGSPTGGSYIITWSDGTNTHATAPIPFAAQGGQVAAALQQISQLGQVTVSSTGTSPNYTHTVTFTGIGGAVANLGTVSFLTGGSSPLITQAVVTAADAHSYLRPEHDLRRQLGRDHHDLRGLAHTGRQHGLFSAFSGLQTRHDQRRQRRHGHRLDRGRPGGPVLDAQGNHNTVPITVSGTGAITADTWGSYHQSLRYLPGTTQPVYLKVTTTGLPSGGKVYFDDFALVAGQQLYNGGPLVAAFRGRTASAVTDTWSYAVSNA